MWEVKDQNVIPIKIWLLQNQAVFLEFSFIQHVRNCVDCEYYRPVVVAAVLKVDQHELLSVCVLTAT